jgi:AcrR family transcriptional regulator
MAGSARPRGDSERTRARLRVVVRQLFVQKGYHGTSIRDIAAAADLSTASLYHYAAGKDELFADALLESLEIYIGRSTLVTRSTLPTALKLRVLIRDQVQIHAHDRQNWGGASDEWKGLPPRLLRPLLQLRRKHESNWRQVIEEGIKEGILVVNEPRMTTLAILGMCAHVSLWFSQVGRLTPAELGDLYTEYALRMMNAKPSCIKRTLEYPAERLETALTD